MESKSSFSSGGYFVPARVAGLFVVAVAVHSLAVGVMLVFFPRWAVRFGGWGAASGLLFFVRQGGVFHFVVAFAYLWDWFTRRSLVLMVVTKAVAVAFLAFMCAVMDPLPWSVPVSAVLDGLMGAAAVFISNWLSGH